MNPFNNFLGKALLKKQMKSAGVPDEQQEMMLNMITKNPKLFEKIAKETKEKVDGGMDQMAAMQEVMMSHQAELMEAFKESN